MILKGTSVPLLPLLVNVSIVVRFCAGKEIVAIQNRSVKIRFFVIIESHNPGPGAPIAYARSRRVFAQQNLKKTLKVLRPCGCLQERSCVSKGIRFAMRNGKLKRGGADLPENMQWQSAAEAKAKDRVE